MDAFLARLRTETPPLARIDSVAVRELRPTGENGFRIVASEVLGRVSTGIPADAATCADCLRELLDPDDRRYRYPFLNCTNCGPRFTITRRIPYDRPQTSMAQFTMCAACQAEYDDPAESALSRAAQCVLGVRAAGLAGECADGTDDCRTRMPVAATIDRLAGGEIMAIKGIGGFHLSVDATNEAAVTAPARAQASLWKAAGRDGADLEAARAICALTAEEEALLMTSARPIVLARTREGLRHRARVSRREFRGWACFCLTRRCSICCLLIATSAGAGDDLGKSERRADCD